MNGHKSKDAEGTRGGRKRDDNGTKERSGDKNFIFTVFHFFYFFDYLLQKATLTFTSGVVSAVTQQCATTCFATNTVACTQVANKNQVLGCYVGTYFTTSSTSTFAKTICPLLDFLGKSAGFCKVRHLTKFKWGSLKKQKIYFYIYKNLHFFF